MELKTNIIIRYCQAIDRFIKVRVFSDSEIQHLFKNVNLTGKRSYQQLVINTAIVNYSDNLSQEATQLSDMIGKDAEWLEDELYQLIIRINPAMDINRVSINMEEKETPDKLFLLEGVKDARQEESILSLEKRLQERVVGQDEAISKVVHALKRAQTGIKSPDRPVGCFLFAGQTGVGKTELAKNLAEMVLGDGKNMLRIDCSEYALPHEYSKLIGAPPGYVGYDDGGVLSAPMHKKPETVVLFDEIEKANGKVHNLLLQIMDEGFATDNKGRRIDFNKSIIIMTSNVGAGAISDHEGAIGFGDRKSEVDHNFKEKQTIMALEGAFAPEFMNRIDDVVIFRALDNGDNIKIVDILLKQVSERLGAMGKKIVFPTRIKEHLARKIQHSRYGARPLKRIVSRYIETPLSDCLLNCKFKEAGEIKVSLKKGKVGFYPA
ncbi:MAG: ATP-dependent Clp protease ATP-binding subunit [Proteobacteria bacterium]|nr:ATP-dependent Clp protease ATP-binding subunit [Pseudomonadota bacterium]